MLVDGDDRVAGAQADLRRRRLRIDFLDRAIRVAGGADHVRDDGDQDREQDVHGGPGKDDGNPLPRPLPPVRVVGDAVAQFGQATPRRAFRRRSELRRGDRALELRERLARRREVSHFEHALYPRRLREQTRILFQRRPELHVDVRRRRAVHPGDLHVTAQRDRADPVLDLLAPHLHERRREAEIKAARAHPDRPRNEEVPRLVEQDEEREPEDGDRNAHDATFNAASA